MIDKAREIAEHIMGKLSSYDYDDYEVYTAVKDHALTRYANSVIHQQVGGKSLEFTIRVNKGKRVASISSSYSEQDLKKILDQLSETVKFVPVRDYFQGFTEDQVYPKLDPVPFELDPERRGEMIERAVNAASEIDQSAKLFGKVEELDYSYCYMNSNDLSNAHRFGFNDFKVLSIIEEGDNRGFGREVVASPDPASIDVEAMARSAAKISKDTLHAESIEPGEYPVILRPQAGIELLSYSLYGLSAQPFHQKYSAFSDRIGEQVFDSDLTLIDKPLENNSLIPSPFDAEGMAKRNSLIVDHGVPKQVFYSNMDASKYLGNKNLSTAHSVLPYSDYFFGGSAPTNIFMETGDTTEEEIISDTKKALLVQTLWYSNPVNMVKGVLTGLTRDGLYYVEAGEIKYAVKNMRYTDTFLSFFQNFGGITKDATSLFGDLSAGTIPTFKLDRLKFVSKSKH